MTVKLTFSGAVIDMSDRERHLELIEVRRLIEALAEHACSLLEYADGSDQWLADVRDSLSGDYDTFRSTLEGLIAAHIDPTGQIRHRRYGDALKAGEMSRKDCDCDFLETYSCGKGEAS